MCPDQLFGPRSPNSYFQKKTSMVSLSVFLVQVRTTYISLNPTDINPYCKNYFGAQKLPLEQNVPKLADLYLKQLKSALTKSLERTIVYTAKYPNTKHI